MRRHVRVVCSTVVRFGRNAVDGCCPDGHIPVHHLAAMVYTLAANGVFTPAANRSFLSAGGDFTQVIFKPRGADDRAVLRVADYTAK